MTIKFVFKNQNKEILAERINLEYYPFISDTVIINNKFYTIINIVDKFYYYDDSDNDFIEKTYILKSIY